MVWPFSKKKQELPENLIFKDGRGFFEYQCKFGHTEIIPKQGIIALVLDSSKEFGTANPVKIEEDGTQIVALRVVSDDGGFTVISRTASGKGARLVSDDIVIWVPIMHSPEIVPPEVDKRFGWTGFVVARVAPEIDLASDNFNLTSRYD